MGLHCTNRNYKGLNTVRFKQNFTQRAGMLCVAATFTVVSAFAGSENHNLQNFQKVDDKVYRGAQPTDEGFKELAERRDRLCRPPFESSEDCGFRSLQRRRLR